MNPLSYLSILPGLLSRRPGESRDTQAGRSGLMDANAAYQGMRNSYQQQADTYGGKFNTAASNYQDLLSRPVGSDAEDVATIGHAQEGINMGARRSAARIANNPSVVAGSSQAGAMASIEQRRLAGEAQLHAKVADMNLMERRQRQATLVDFLSRQLARNQGGAMQALQGQQGINSQLLGLGRQQDAVNQQNSAFSAQGMMQLLAQLGMGNEKKQ